MEKKINNSPIRQPLNLWIMGIIYPLITFAYGTVNSLLILYLQNQLGFSSTQAYSLFAVFNALIFTLPIIGGHFADYFGHREATIIGMVLCIVGLLVPGTHSLLMLKIGLACFAVGLAICATTSYCIIDFSYEKQDNRRESGFTLFYLMFNIGFLISIILAGYLAESIGYHATIALSAVAVVIALILFIASLPFLKANATRTFKGIFNFHPFINLLLLAAIFSITVIVCVLLLERISLTNSLMFALIIASVIGVIIFAYKQHDKDTRLKLIAFLSLAILSTGFWSLYMLEPSLLTVFINTNVDRSIAGHIIPSSSFYSLDSIYIIIFGLMLSYLWRRLAIQSKGPSIPTKFTSALFFMGIGYFIFVIGILTVGHTGMVNVSWVFIGYIFLSLAELLLSPTGLSMVGRLSPPGREGLLMGIWQLFIGFSAILSAFLADIAITPTSGSPITTNPIYLKALILIGSLAIVFGIVSTFFIPLLKRLITVRSYNVN